MRRLTVTVAGAVALAALLVSGLVACSHDAAPASDCPNDRPESCPANPPSYRDTVEPIFERRCFACHTDGGVAASKFDFGTYDRIASKRSPILNQVYACTMPPADAAPPSPTERAALLNWLVCHAPNN